MNDRQTPTGEGRAAQAARRTQRLRQASTAGAIAALGVFTGLAATGPQGNATPAQVTTPATAAPAEQTQAPATSGGFFDSGGSTVLPGDANALPDAQSGGS